MMILLSQGKATLNPNTDGVGASDILRPYSTSLGTPLIPKCEVSNKIGTWSPRVLGSNITKIRIRRKTIMEVLEEHEKAMQEFISFPKP